MYTQQPIIQRVQKLLAKKPVYLDTETTGVYPTDEIVEICIVDHDGQILLDSLVKPYSPIPAETTRFHHITNAMVQDAPTWRDIWPEVQAILTYRVSGYHHNARIDARRSAANKRAVRLQEPHGSFLSRRADSCPPRPHGLLWRSGAQRRLILHGGDAWGILFVLH